MEKSSKFDFQGKLETLFQEGVIPEKEKTTLGSFFKSYVEAVEPCGIPASDYLPLFATYLDLIKREARHPYQFQPFHQHLLKPFDYYTFGIDFLKPLVEIEFSTVRGLDKLSQIEKTLAKKENVILFANHQIEADPQAISILLEKSYPKLAENLIFVAGERVITDLLAIPFSLGRNLLCIYSKRYIDFPPEEKHKKQLHNKNTMELMRELLNQGGKIIYVAPSGGRDRPNAAGIVEVAHFDPQSIEMFYLMSKKASKRTHFFPMALSTYNLLPPPETVQVELGETRVTKRAAIHLAVGAEIDMESFPNRESKDKYVRRKSRADYIWNLVKKDYDLFPGVT
ncbi:MAG TPA: 1-acyl-sn-glycerol-3-phosphate acyltransferase [Rhabdochlamydiaceae bacterium]|nr:1-acyl-sn-glycerol-3-phosphate acyltransferase [Rhabdochlamydiaceae bacterium]